MYEFTSQFGTRLKTARTLGVTAVAVVAGSALVACSSSSSGTSSPSSTAPADTASTSTASTADTSSTSTVAGGGAAKTGAPTGSGTYKILVVDDTSGPSSFYGAQHTAALKGAADYWNAHGGIGNEKVAISFVNSNSDPSTAVTSMLQWVSSHGKPDLVVDALTGATDAGMAPAIKRLGVLSIGSDSAEACDAKAQTTCPFNFAAGPDTIKFTSLTEAAWMKAKGYKKVGLLTEQDAFDQGETTGLEAALKADGIQSVSASFATTAVDVAPELAKLTSQNVDVLFGGAVGPAAGYIATARLNAGKAASLPLLFDLAAGAQDLTKLISTAGWANSYEVIGRTQDPSQKIPGRDAIYTYGAKYGKINTPLAVANVWDAIVLAHNAAAQAGSTKPADMTKALENLSPANQVDPAYAYTGKYQFTADNHHDVDGTGTFTIVKTGPINAKGEVISPK